MDNKENIWSAIVTVLLGVVLVCLHSVTTKLLVMVMGGILIATGIVNFLAASTGKNADGSKRSPGALAIITSIAAVVLGLWWVIDPATNVMIIVRLIGALAILSGIYRIYDMKVTFKHVKFPVVFYILPVLVLGCGVFMEIWPQWFADILVMLVGIVLIVYGVAMLCQGVRIRTFKLPEGPKQEVEDVEAHEVKDDDNKPSTSSWAADR